MLIFRRYTQKEGYKCLTTGSAKGKKVLVCSTANFHGVGPLVPLLIASNQLES